ncbi:TPA: restriction endonuclease subunit S [Serratia marcescens]|uniref:restriction endonuclease subunit S n=1 Tax=Serratia sp. CMO1 TaxID=2785630 RepID=UPI0018D9A880|nr:restriction endonuclease subunit S [Serratia sp. CMO1]MBH3205069.1 restriction endonuclease subunit S [Serratia marcescens]QPI32406.1 restriction endonuclease subunit S [Serratia sp. CMO1]HEJ9067378.1 restriction endonuclease subunit S [Serratia marcescens]HEJ9108180.1 restriction endonuclease subunit S [Serratia marcescens]
MNKQQKKNLVPQLRFPEFQKSEAWEWEPLGSIRVAEFVKERAPLGELSLNTYISTENLLPDFSGVTIASKLPPSGSFTKYKKGDVLISNIRPYLKKVWLADQSGAASNDVIVIRSRDEVISGFLTGILKNDDFISYVMKGAKGVKMPRGDISSMKEFPIAFPAPKEQQKIADCLTALDELITLNTKKLEAIQLHKKGLVQQLFPAEGETEPKLRFHEFLNEGNWEEKEIGQISTNVTTGGTPSTSEKSYWDGCIKWMNSGELNYKRVYDVQSRITEVGLQNSSTKIIPSMCVLIGLAGQGKTRGTVAMNMVELCINQSIAAIFPNPEIFSSDFLYHNLDNRYDELRRLSAGGEGRGGLNLQIIKSMVVALPSILEQQKIADCLTALDELISLYVQKLQTLKIHKKGLVQQLFPTMEEVI